MFFVLGLVATPFIFTAWLISRIFQHRERMRAVEAGPPPAALPPARPDLEERIRNLEAIVCSEDWELNRRFKQVG